MDFRSEFRCSVTIRSTQNCQNERFWRTLCAVVRAAHAPSCSQAISVGVLNRRTFGPLWYSSLKCKGESKINKTGDFACFARDCARCVRAIRLQNYTYRRFYQMDLRSEFHCSATIRSTTCQSHCFRTEVTPPFSSLSEPASKREPPCFARRLINIALLTGPVGIQPPQARRPGVLHLRDRRHGEPNLHRTQGTKAYSINSSATEDVCPCIILSGRIVAKMLLLFMTSPIT